MKRLISILCAVTMIFGLTGCGQKGPEDVVKKFWAAAQKCDVVTMSSCLTESDRPDPEDLPDLSPEDIPVEVLRALKDHAKNLTYEIGAVTKNEKTAKVPVSVSYPDLSVAVAGAIGEYAAEALGSALSGGDLAEQEGLFEEILAKNLREAEPQMKERTINFNCVMTEEGWRIEIRPKDVRDLLLGGILEDLDQLNGLT